MPVPGFADEREMAFFVKHIVATEYPLFLKGDAVRDDLMYIHNSVGSEGDSGVDMVVGYPDSRG